MTLSAILDRFRDHDLDSLSRRTKEAAVGCGEEMRHPKELPFEDWNVIDEMAESIFGANASEGELVTVFLEFYECFPGYHALTIMFRWYDHHPGLPEPVKSELWRRLAAFLDADAALADPVAYVLWVDRFEDPSTVAEAWRGLVSNCASELALRRLLEVSGPVPFELKEPLYSRLMPDPKFHPAILKSLYFSAHDVYGQLDRERAKSILEALTVDRDSVEFRELSKAIFA